MITELIASTAAHNLVRETGMDFGSYFDLALPRVKRGLKSGRNPHKLAESVKAEIIKWMEE